jgi:hypothetical protein
MRTKFFLPILILGISLFFVSSCGEADPCKDVNCGANGTCFLGECVCNEGFEGAGCAAEWSAKFVGSYLGRDVCKGTTYTLKTPAVFSRVDGSTVQIANFGGFDDAFIRAKIKRKESTSTTADVLDLTFTDAKQRRFTGTATISGNKITGTYTVTYSDNTSDNCTFEYTK